MNREKQLIKNSAIIGIGRLLPKLISVITLPIITSQLTKTEFGIYDLVSTLVMFLLPIATLQVHSAGFRFLIDARNDKEKITKIVTNIFAIVIPISVVVSFSLFFILRNISSITKFSICMYLISDILFLCISQICRGLSYNKIYSIGSVIVSTLNALGIVFSLIINDYGITGIIISLCVSHIIALIFIFFKIKIFRYINLKYISKSDIKEIIKYSWPMIPNNLSVWILNLSDRVVISSFLGLEANAIYAVANKIPQFLSIAQSIFVMAWQENASIAIKDKDADLYFSNMFKKIFKLMFSVTIILIAFTPIIFKILIRGDYSKAYVQIPILFLAMFFNCMASFFGGIYIAYKQTKKIGTSTMVIAGINLLIDLVLVKLIGITAGSLSTLVAYLCLYIYRCIDVKNFQKINLFYKMQIIFIAIIIFMLILCFCQNMILNIINIIIGIILFAYCNVDIINLIIKKIKKVIKI